MSRFLSGFAFAAAALLVSCSSDSDRIPSTNQTGSGHVVCQVNAREDLVTAATWNMAIGFDVKDLFFLNLDSVRVIHSRAEKMFSDAERALPRLRIRLMAEEIARNRPEVVGLQETMHLARNGRLIADFMDTLESDLRALGTDYQILRRPLNKAVLRIAAAPDNTGKIDPADTIEMDFHEGQAMLISRRWTVVHEGIIPFKNVIPVDMLGLKTNTDRSAQWAWLRDSSGFQLEVWNTHLEILESYTKSQAGEFAVFADSLRGAMTSKGFSPSGRLFLGDINVLPGSDIEAILLRSGWYDNWNESRLGPGYSYGGGSMRDSTRLLTKRYDRILSQGACTFDTTYIRGDKAVLTDSGPLFPSDHALIVSKFRYGIRP